MTVVQQPALLPHNKKVQAAVCKHDADVASLGTAGWYLLQAASSGCLKSCIQGACWQNLVRSCWMLSAAFQWWSSTSLTSDP